MPPSRMVTSSRRAGRVTNKTKLLIYRGSDKIDLSAAETIVWDHDPASGPEATKAQHVGAKGVESGELLEHHLQAALSSASLLHSRPQLSKPSSPSSNHRQTPNKPEVNGSTNSTLNYHIPTPDATGLVAVADYAELYGNQRYIEPVNYIRFSDTVEESSGGPGGLGYCMDDDDVEWLMAFNSKAEGSSGGGGEAPGTQASPVTVANGQTPNQGRGMRVKGKEREKAETPAPLFISEDTFEFVMGVLEKHAEDNVPMLHTNLSLLPPFSSIEPLFSSPLPASFFPSNEVPKGLPETKILTRITRCIYPHWKSRREKRRGHSIMPQLNYDETNDGDPYVCFRRRDIRATRKTRRTDNFSVEKLQKIQYEMKKAFEIATMIVRRETEKQVLYKSDEQVWRAKWHLFEIKRRWPSLGMTREEEEIITGRPTGGVPSSASMPGHLAMSTNSMSTPQIRKKIPERERDERERREQAMAAARAAAKGSANGTDRSIAPEALKERMMALHQKVDEELARKKELDSHWDDCTDHSYQPFPTSHSNHAFRPISFLGAHDDDQSFSQDDDDRDILGRPLRPSAFRLRRGRGGVVRLDRRPAVFSRRRGVAPKDYEGYHDWLFHDISDSRTTPERHRPRSVDEAELKGDLTKDKKRRLNESWRYDVDRGGGLGVGMGMAEDTDRVIIDDLDPKYIRHRIALLQDTDVERLRPDPSPLAQVLASFDIPLELPPTPVFVRPQLPSNSQIQAAQYQQQMLQQQQLAQFQQYQLMAQQQAMENQRLAQQQALAQGQPQSQGQAQPSAQGQVQAQQLPPVQGQGGPQTVQQRIPSNDGSVNGVPPSNGIGNGQPQLPGQAVPQGMLPPNGVSGQNGRPAAGKRPSQNVMPPPNQPRPSVSPTNSLHPVPQTAQTQLGMIANIQSPQMINGMMLPNGKGGFIQPGTNGQPQLDPAMQQRILAARAAQAAMVANGATANAVILPSDINFETGNPEQQAELTRLSQQAGFGGNIQGFIEARNRAKLLRMAQAVQQQQAAQGNQQVQIQVQGQQDGGGGNGNSNVNGTTNGNHQTQPVSNFSSPVLPSGQLQLKFPAHAAAKLGATGQQQQQQQPQQRA